jgi:hypothetical protein
MITVKVKTSDSVVWNINEAHSKIAQAVFANEDLTIDLMNEGPDRNTLGLDKYINQLIQLTHYTGKIYYITCNTLESPSTFPSHLILNAFEYQTEINKTQNLKHFGLFIGRGNAPRLYLSSYLYNNHREKIVHTNHLDLNNEFFAANIGIERLMTEYNIADITDIAEYIKECPIGSQVEIDKTLDSNPAQQLLQNDSNSFLNNYNHFAIEIVCETYFTGNTFFPTEKVWRPILLKTPFIVQGPTGFLKNLRNLGFKTFYDFWDEGYDEDPHAHSIHEITRLIDTLAKEPVEELNWMLYNMQDILEHNYNRLLELYHGQN